MRRHPATAGILAVLLGIGLLAPPPATAASGTPPRLGPLTAAYQRSAEAMRAAGSPYADWTAAGRRFLAFDRTGDGTAVEVVGDLDRAERVVVLVPGVATSLPDFDRGLGGVARRAPAAQARTVYAALRAAEPDTPVAVVAWLGYDPPDGLGLAAARGDRARSGGRSLAAFLSELAGQRPAATVTAIGHSYGALVLGYAAARLPRQVTDLVAVGGVGMGVDRAADLATSARMWAAEAPDDWIRRIPQHRLGGLGHGVRPATARFGARALSTDGVSGHDGYLEAGTGTVRGIVSIALHGTADR
ncbi:alpha/beta hydrolase [Plantactinospora sp. GCM10030261]|uniref:alpha/beta hydrolase n=1 Tax=Plantactinospora sp. GCM10030261 TaxID=3273420 RepID=UPI00361F2F07